MHMQYCLYMQWSVYTLGDILRYEENYADSGFSGFRNAWDESPQPPPVIAVSVYPPAIFGLGHRIFFLPVFSIPYQTPLYCKGIKKARSLVPLLVPLFISAFRRANDLAMAMEARCYRGGEHRLPAAVLPGICSLPPQ